MGCLFVKVSKVIEKATKIIGLDLRYFFKNGSWVFIRYVVIGLSGLVMSIGFTRLGTKELFGQYQFILNFLALLSVFSLPGLNVVALRAVSLQEYGVIKKVVTLSFFSSLLALPIIIAYGAFSIFGGNLLFGKTMLFAGILFPFFYAPNTWYAFFEGQSLFKEVSIRIILNNILLAIVMLATLLLGGGLFWVVFAYLGLSVAFNWLFYFEIAKKIKKTSDKLDLKYGISCTIQKFTYSFSETIPVLVISFAFGFKALAIYQIAYFMIALVTGLVSALSATYLPLLFKYKKINYFQILWQNLLIGFVIFIGFAVFIKFLFFIFYGEDYRESYNLVQVLSFILILIPLRLFLINYFTSINKNNLIITTNLFANAVSFLVFYLIKNTGFVFSVSTYFYTLNLFIITPLLLYYFVLALKKTGQISV